MAHLTQAKQAANLTATGSRISLTVAEVALEQIANLPPAAIGPVRAIARAALAEIAVPAFPAVPKARPGMSETFPFPRSQWECLDWERLCRLVSHWCSSIKRQK